MNNTAIVLLGEDKIRADMFFDRPLIETDWDQVRAQVAAGQITKEAVLSEIREMEPLQSPDPRDLQHWILQQKLRLCLVHEAGKQMELQATCECCGSRKVDILFGEQDRYRRVCLHCAEHGEQAFSGGYRGNCQYLRPTYNPQTRCWGLLYYWSHDRDPIIFWLADFYKTREEAEAALQPIEYFKQWLGYRYKGMARVDFDDLIGVEDAMQLKLPLTPDSFREVLRSKIEAQMQQEHQVMSYYVHQAMDEHSRKERDE